MVPGLNSAPSAFADGILLEVSDVHSLTDCLATFVLNGCISVIRSTRPVNLNYIYCHVLENVC